MGFDDLPEAQWSSPPLTTVRQPLDQMGRLAVHTLHRLTDGDDVASPRVELATELKVRASTAPPRGATGGTSVCNSAGRTDEQRQRPVRDSVQA